MNHTPVLLKECIEGLCIKPHGIYIDGTLGRGGHAGEIAKNLTSGKLIAIDRDMDAIRESEKLFDMQPELKSKITFEHANFKDLAKVLEKNKISRVDGMLFDLGTSSPQLDNSERGFSYMNDANLDMRMNREEELTAFDLINNSSEDELRRIFYEYGEERYSKSISKAIVLKRVEASIDTTFELNEIILSAIPAKARREPQHPSKRVFQALRIAVNNELGSIEELLDIIPHYLASKGRVCIISFHSLEDRLVKRSYIKYSSGCTCPKDLPICVCNVKPIMKIINKKPIVPTNEEIKENPRARSAKLRIAEKI